MIRIQSYLQSKKMAFNLLVFLAAIPAYAIPEKDVGNLGEVRQSLLSKEDFQAMYGDAWVEMNGQDIESSDLYKEKLWSSKTIPNASGVFLRCSNNGRTAAEGNPDGDIAVGTFQADEVVSHHHGFTPPNAGIIGTHELLVGLVPRSRAEMGGLQPGGAMGDGGQLGAARRHFPAHTISVGGSETRPRCITVNTYIKINRTPNSQQTDVIMEKLEGIPAQIAGNEALAKIIKNVVQQEVKKAMADAAKKIEG